MTFIEVPKFNEDGSVETTVRIKPAEAQYLLQFAVNFLQQAGTVYMAEEDAPQTLQ